MTTVKANFNPYELICNASEYYGVPVVKDMIHITAHKKTKKRNNKMDGISSVSTNPLENRYCLTRHQCKPMICSNCYSFTQLKLFPNMVPKLEKNTDLLTKSLIHWDYLPIISSRYFRFESFGDLMNEVQFENYLNICLKNPDVHCAIWTKNPFIMERVFERREKLDNLIIVVSSVYKNQVAEGQWSFADKTFTVYTKEYADDHDIKINCGARNCLECGLCYSKNDVTEINEMLKSDQAAEKRKKSKKANKEGR